MDSLKRFTGEFSGYTELRRHTNLMNTITLLKGNPVANNRAVTGGISARSMVDGSWGMSSSPGFSDEIILKLIKAARDNAAFLSSRQKKNMPPFYSNPIVIEKDHRTTKPRTNQQHKLEFLSTLDNYINEKYPTLLSRRMHFSGIDTEKLLVNSDGTESYSYIPRSHIFISMTTEKDGRPIDLPMYLEEGGLGEFEDFFEDPSTAFEQIDRLYERLMEKRDGVYASGGLHDVILAPDLAGILAHEAVGHTVESDIVLGGAVSAGLLGKRVGSELVNMVDFAHTAFGETCQVPVYADDEGIAASDVVLIENGILTGYLLNKQDAVELGQTPKGNARAFAFSDEPLVRMRNTYILPGKDKLADMIASVENGYYLECPSNGQADMTSEFMFAVKMGYEIKNGKLGRAIFDTTVSGIAFELLQTVSMLSDDMKVLSSGMCGKKQPISVSMGGPAIKCKIQIGGK